MNCLLETRGSREKTHALAKVLFSVQRSGNLKWIQAKGKRIGKSKVRGMARKESMETDTRTDQGNVPA